MNERIPQLISDHKHKGRVAAIECIAALIGKTRQGHLNFHSQEVYMGSGHDAFRSGSASLPSGDAGASSGHRGPPENSVVYTLDFRVGAGNEQGQEAVWKSVRQVTAVTKVVTSNERKTNKGDRK